MSRAGGLQGKCSGQPRAAQRDTGVVGLWGEITAASLGNRPQDLDRPVLCSGH